MTLLFESISRSATRESNFSCETSGISGLKLKLFFSNSTLPVKHITKIHIKYTYRPLNISQSIDRDFQANWLMTSITFFVNKKWIYTIELIMRKWIPFALLVPTYCLSSNSSEYNQEDNFRWSAYYHPFNFYHNFSSSSSNSKEQL